MSLREPDLPKFCYQMEEAIKRKQLLRLANLMWENREWKRYYRFNEENARDNYDLYFERKCKDFLNDNIDNLFDLFERTNINGKIVILKAFGLLQNSETIEKIFDIALRHKNEKISEAAFAALQTVRINENGEIEGCWVERTSIFEIMATNAIQNLQGKRKNRLIDVIFRIENIEVRNKILESVGRFSCPICRVEDIDLPLDAESTSYFVAHPFTKEKKQKLRPAIESAISKIDKKFKPQYADSIRGKGHILVKICRAIHFAKFAIFDIEPNLQVIENPEKVKANPNVAFELGLAMLQDKESLLISRESYNPFADIAGYDCIIYRDYDDLKNQIPDKVKDILSKSN